MESHATKHSETLQQFQGLLKELFEFECADLDFGIYRIMNHKREIIKDFIENKLPNKCLCVGFSRCPPPNLPRTRGRNRHSLPACGEGWGGGYA